MRFVPVLILALLMLGFAARPTVSAALSDGRILTHPFVVTTAAATDLITEASPDESKFAFTHCVALGVLQSALLLARRPKAAVGVHEMPIGLTPGRLYSILRPPRFEA